MPIRRYNLLQGYLMQDTGIGSTMTSVEQHFKNLDAFLTSGKLSEAIQERSNLHMNIYAAIEGISFKSMAFACMIHTMDKIPVVESDDELQKAVEKFDELTIGDVEDILDELKQNCIGN